MATRAPRARSVDAAPYHVTPTIAPGDGDVVARALAILDARMRSNPIALDSPQAVKDYLRLAHAEHQFEHECFGVIYLDARNHMITAEILFRGTLTQASVYPREVVKHALRHNAAAIILHHNHPSGGGEPSRSDEYLTQQIKNAMAYIDVKVLDHFVVGDGAVTSFAERGLL